MSRYCLSIIIFVVDFRSVWPTLLIFTNITRS